MSNNPPELKYAKTHEWARVEEDGAVTIGITDHAQEALGDVVYIEVRDVGDALAVGGRPGGVESVKAASDIYSPVAGKVVAVNPLLEDSPETVNSDPYNDGWFFRLQPEDPAELDGLLSAEDYSQLCEDED